METSDHLQRQWAFPVEHFRHSCTASQVGFQLTAAEPATFHVILDRFDRVWGGNAVVLLLVSFHERGEHLKTVSLGRMGSRVKEAVDFGQRGLILHFCVDRPDVHSDVLFT